MHEIDELHTRIRAFEKVVNEHKGFRAHKDNKFNKQFSALLTEWHYIQIIIERIENADSNNATQLKLDLKTLYVFGRVFVESLLYMSSLFIDSSKKINWTKIGPFVKSAEDNGKSEAEEFVNFWQENRESVYQLLNTFRYRNDVLHEKNSNTEWIFAWPGRSNLDQVFIANVPWKEDIGEKEKRSLNARTLISVLQNETAKILDYLESRTVA
jgi:hypothetical protein